MTDNLKHILSGADPLASDVQQIIDALTGANDVGQLALFASIAAPAAPGVAAGAVGILNGTYRYKVTNCTGYRDSDGTLRIGGETAGGATASIAVASKQVDLTLAAGPAGTVARRIYRTAAGGADGTQKLVTTINDNTTLAWSDNIADAALGAAVPVANTTGSSLVLQAAQLIVSGTLALAALNATGNLQAAQLISTIANGTAPLQVTSQTAVTNLSADMVDGKHAADFAAVLAGGVKIQSGRSTAPAGDLAGYIVFPVAFATAPIVLVSYNRDSAYAISVANVSTTGAIVYATANLGYGYYWIAIGS